MSGTYYDVYVKFHTKPEHVYRRCVNKKELDNLMDELCRLNEIYTEIFNKSLIEKIIIE